MTSELFKLGLMELQQLLLDGACSAVELTGSLLERIERHRSINAFLEVCGEPALAAARKADDALAKGRRLPLLGLPLALKDIILTKDIPTTCASRMLEGFVPPHSATAAERLTAAGAVTIGKTNLDEFAMGSSNEGSAFGPVLNPWDRERVPGGSSGGSAAAVALGLVPAALGTDTGGSVRQPASFCGIVGLKPTYGRVSRYGVIAFASSLDQIGVLARSIADCALVMNVIAGRDPLDGTSVEQPVPDFRARLDAGVAGLRIGVPREYFVDGLQPDVSAAVQQALRRLEELGAELKEISLPHTEAAIATYYIIAPAEASSNLSRYDGIRYGSRAAGCSDLADLYSRTRSEGFGVEVKRRILVGTYVLSKGYYDAYYLRAQKARQLIARDFRQAFETECDLIAAPTAPTTAFRIGEKSDDPLAMYLNDVFTVPASLAGLPGLSVPCGFDSEGLPIGLQLIGPPWAEAALFQAGAAYEYAENWGAARPPEGEPD